jgi:hypothetical protein
MSLARMKFGAQLSKQRLPQRLTLLTSHQFRGRKGQCSLLIVPEISPGLILHDGVLYSYIQQNGHCMFESAEALRELCKSTESFLHGQCYAYGSSEDLGACPMTAVLARLWLDALDIAWNLTMISPIRRTREYQPPVLLSWLLATISS